MDVSSVTLQYSHILPYFTVVINSIEADCAIPRSSGLETGNEMKFKCYYQINMVEDELSDKGECISHHPFAIIRESYTLNQICVSSQDFHAMTNLKSDYN